MSKTFRHIAVMVFLTVMGTLAHAQVVAIRLEIPAGINFSAQVLDPMEGGTWENSNAKVWVGIEAHENLTFLLDLVFPEREILPPPEAYFLNDGSADFETASKLGVGSQELQMKNLPRLIRNMEPRPSQLQAWLGLPTLNGIKIKIEYP
ncbi:MAG: hypothetical protein C0433_10490 [Cyclobacterium sp.]|nr:hypothetical protein [Cyclobacterium sp.]